MEEIKVYVVKRRDREALSMRYKCPSSGRPISRSTGTSKRREAEKIAAKWEAELQDGRYRRSAATGWPEFRDMFFEEHLCDLAPRTRDAYAVALNVFERLCRPKRLKDVTTERVAHLKVELRREGKRPSTVASYLRHLKAAFRWAAGRGLLAVVPDCKLPKVADTMKGRPITLEEFERMLAAVPRVVRESDVEDWRFYLRALWLSGLRLTESLTLTWDERLDAISVDLSGRRPMLRIPAAVEKGKRNRLLPMTPDFAELLDGVDAENRRGRVFRINRPAEKVSAKISEIGKAAGVRVADDKFASAHDLRRAFGTRWSKVLSPARLKAIMRHATIETTMRYYVAEESEELADALFQAAGESWVPVLVPEATKHSAESNGGNGGSPYEERASESGGQGIRTLNRLPGN